MIQIKQSTETTFSAISMRDAITMLPVMDRLHNDHKSAIATYEKHFNKEDKDRWDYNDKREDYKKAIIAIENQLAVLYKLGFVPSVDMCYQSYFPV